MADKGAMKKFQGGCLPGETKSGSYKIPKRTVNKGKKRKAK